MKWLSSFGLASGLLLILACSQNPAQMTGPTIGSLRIAADTTMKNIVTQEEDIFERAYPYAHLDIDFMEDATLFQKFFADSIDVIMSTRTLSGDELKFFHDQQSYPRQVVFATGAIAFVRSKQARDSTYTYEHLIGLMKGNQENIVFVLENAKSGITHEILRLIGEEKLPAHFYALNTKTEVFTYINGHSNAIGIVDYSDFSDSDSAYTKEVLREVQLLGISRPADSTQVGFVWPYQYNLQDRLYPFTRDLYFISKTGKDDVGTGFASFICGDIGQKIILKSGLLPKFQTERIIELNPTSDIKVVK